MIRIAVWGVGPHARKNVLPAISQAPGYELAGVCSRSQEAREQAAREWGGASWASPEEMLRSDRVDLVYLSTPTGLHAAQGMAVLRSAKHLVCEKSLTGDLANSLSLTEYAAEHGLLVCEALAFLHHPRFAMIRDLVSAPAFGVVRHAFCAFGLPPLESPGFRTSRELGGSALLDLGCYPLAATRALFGGDGSVLRSTVATLPGDDVDTFGDATLAFAEGVRVDAAWGYNRAYQATLLVWGERQSLQANRLFSRDTVDDSGITLRDRTGEAMTMFPPMANGFVALFAAVRESLTDDRKRAAFIANAADQAKLLGEVKRCAT